MASVIGSLRAELSATVATFQRDLGKAADSVKGFATEAGRVGKDFTKIGRQMESVGANLTKSLTLPFAGLATAAILAGKTVDEALDTIRAGTGATGDRLEELGQSFRKVFKDLPNSAQQVADAITEISQRTGLAGKPLEDLTVQVLNLSRLTKTELTGTVTSVTRVFGDWSIATADQSKALDFLFRTSQQTGIEFNKLSDLVVQFGAPMRALGFSFEQTAALMGKFEKEGVNLETVMSGLRFALGKFAKAGVEPEAAFKQVSAAIKNAKTESEATAIAFDTFGKRAAIDMSRAIIEGRFAIDDLVSSLSTGKDGINAAAEATLSASEKFSRFKNNVIAAIEPLGKRLTEILEQNVLPMVQRVVEVVGKMVDVFVALPSPVQNALLIIAGGLAALGPGLFIAGQLVSTAGSIATAFGKTGIATRALLAVLEGAGGLVGGLKATTVAMEGAAVASKSFQLAMAGVVGLIVGGTLLVALKLYNDELERQQRVSKTGPIDGLKDAFGNVIVPIGKATTEMGEWSGKVQPMGGFVKVATTAVEGLGNALGPTAAELEKAKKAAADFAKEVDKFSGSDLLKQAQQLEKILKAVGGQEKLTTAETRQFVDAFQAVIEKYRLLGPSGRTVVDHFTALLRTLSPLPDAVHAIERGAVDMNRALLGVGTTVKPLMSDLQGLPLVSRSIDLVGQSVQHTGGLLDRTKSSFEGVGDAALQAGQDFKTMGGHLEQSLSRGAQLGEDLKTGLLQSLNAIPQIIVDSLTGGGGTEAQAKAIGATIGATIGGAIGTYLGGPVGFSIGSSIGSAVGQGIAEGFRTAGEDIARRVGLWDIGGITEELGNKLADVAERLFGGNRQAGEIFGLSQIIKEIGGINTDNIDVLQQKLRDTFVLLGQGTFTAAQAASVLDDNFQAFADHFLADGELISKELVDIIHLNDEWGTHSKAIADFITGQVQNKIVPGLVAFTGATRTAGDGLKDNEEKLAGLQARLLEVNTALAEGTGDTAKLTAEQAKLNQEMATVTATMDKQKGVISALAITSEGAATALAASVGVAFSKLQDAGVPIFEIVNQLEPIVAELGQRFADAGQTGGAAFQRLQQIMAIAKDEIAGPVLEALNGLGDTLAGLNNSGFLTQETFAGLTGQIAESFNKLVAGGADAQTALALMKKPLQTIWELQQDFGYAVDESTQLLLDQAVAGGQVGDKFRPVQQQMLMASQKMVEVLEKIASLLEGKLPSAAESGAGKIQGSLDRLRAPTLTIDVEYNDPGPPRYASGSVEGFAEGSGGLRDFGSGTLAVLHGREAVVTESQMGQMGGRSITIAPVLNFTGGDAKDAQTIARETVAAIRLGLVPEFWSL